MKRLKLFIFLILLILIFIFLMNINFLKFLKIYYIQLIILIIIFFLFIFLFKFKFFISFLLIFLISFFYFYIFPNFIQKNSINFSETFYIEEKEKIKEMNLNISLGSGNLKIESNSDKENLIFDYNSIYKVFNSTKIKNDILYYEIFENPVFKRINLSNSEWNLKINENIVTNLNIKIDCINGLFDFRNLKIGKTNIISNSSRIEIYLPEKSENIFLNLQLKPSIVDIYIPEGFYIDINFKTLQSISNILESGFKEKDKNSFYFEGGDMGKIYIKISGNNLNIKIHSIKE